MESPRECYPLATIQLGGLGLNSDLKNWLAGCLQARLGFTEPHPPNGMNNPPWESTLGCFSGRNKRSMKQPHCGGWVSKSQSLWEPVALINGPHTQRNFVSFLVCMELRPPGKCQVTCSHALWTWVKTPSLGLVLGLVLKHLAGTVNGFVMRFGELFTTSLIRPWGTMLPSINSALLPCWRLLSHTGKARYLPNVVFLDPPFQCNEPTGLTWELFPPLVSSLPSLRRPSAYPPTPNTSPQVGAPQEGRAISHHEAQDFLPGTSWAMAW